MSLALGTRVGPYEITGQIGAGGMGEVYRARDSRLDRTVAIKVLSPRITADPEFLERFDREARAISQLNHPHICTLHDVGQHEGVPYLVLEYVEGETLAARLARGPLSIEQALAAGIQISDAVDKAHRQGIMHRDLKPANVMLVGKSGAAPHAKLLDFGLAKAAGAGPGGATATLDQALTVTDPLTARGTLIGTLPYMSPEQIEGREADWRSDIFALGAVLHEMVSGERAFQGASPASVIAAVLERNPPALSTLQSQTPPALDHVVARCLAKEPDDRWQNAGDIMRELKWVASTRAHPAAAPRPSSRVMTYLWPAVALASVALAAMTIIGSTRSRPLDDSTELSLLLPAQMGLRGPTQLNISPDGRHLVFVARERNEERRLWVRPLGSSDARPLEGTERASNPFWSADSRHIGFFVPGQLKRVARDGGPVQPVCPLGEGVGGTWNQNDVILFADIDNGLFRVPAAGGKAVQLGLRGLWPIFLPDGDRFLYVQRPADRRAEEGTPPNLYAASLSSPEGQGVTRVGSNVSYAPPGYLLFLTRVPETTTLVAQPFDPDRMQVRGDPQPLAADIAFTSFGSRGVFSVSATGVLVYLTDPPQDRELVWLDRLGNRLSALGSPGRYAHPAISPNGDLVAFTRIDAPTGTAHIYLAPLARPFPEQFTFGPQRNLAPVFSPEGTRIAFQSDRESQPGLYIKEVDDGKETWTSPAITPTDWSRSGDILGERRQRTGGLFTVPASGAAVPKEFLDTEFTELSPSFSPPHGRWVAYMSIETGRPEIYLRRFDGSGRAIPISNGNSGTDPRWRRDGKELFYLAAERDSLMVVDVQAGESIEASTPRPLFPVNLGSGGDDRPYAVSPNGDRFLMVLPMGNAPPPLTVELNWIARLKR